MYEPIGNSRERTVSQVLFEEAEPPAHLSDVVHRFLDLRTDRALEADYRFHALPDACTYAVFDQRRPEVAGITRLKASSQELNLGRDFHFTNIRFLPGVWQGDVAYGLVDSPYGGALPLKQLNEGLIVKDFAAKQAVLTRFVEGLLENGDVVANPVTRAIFGRLEDVFSVADMAEVAGLSARQLQRVLKATTGFAPHDFLKVLRLQQSLLGEPSLSYADQSHFIHSFKKATGYTPGQFSKKFDV